MKRSELAFLFLAVDLTLIWLLYSSKNLLGTGLYQLAYQVVFAMMSLITVITILIYAKIISDEISKKK